MKPKKVKSSGGICTLDSITDQDMFGHTINLNFNRKGSTYKTCFGGCCSIIINILMFIYVMMNLKKLFFKGDNKYSTQEGLIDYEKLDPI